MKKMNYAVEQVSEEIESRKNSETRHGEQTSPRRYLGLCSTCNYAEGCTLQQNPELPVIFCEEFDSSSPRMTIVHQVPLQPTAPPIVGGMGLCMNCNKRDDCAHQRPEGGIWNCEEYE